MVHFASEHAQYGVLKMIYCLFPCLVPHNAGRMLYSGMKGVRPFFSAAVFTESADARIAIPTLSEMEEAAGDDQARRLFTY